MKISKFILALGIVVAAASVVGTGFSFWYFFEGVETPIHDSAIDMIVETKAEMGHFYNEIHDSDDNKGYMMVITEGQDPDKLDEGISVYKKAVNNFSGYIEPVLEDNISLNFHFDSLDEGNQKALELYDLGFGAHLEISGTSRVDGKNYNFSDFIVVNGDGNLDNADIDFSSRLKKVTDDNSTLDSEEISRGGWDIYSVTVNLAKLFKYRSTDVKPNTLEKYRLLYKAIYSPDDGYECSFSCKISLQMKFIEKGVI